MHVAMLSGEYPPRWGGMGSTVFHLSGEIGKRGHQVTVITRSGGGAGPAGEGIPKQENVTVRLVPWLKVPMAFTTSYGRSALKELTRLNSEHPIDVVHLHLPMLSWKHKQFIRAIEEVAPVLATLDGSWKGERGGMLLAAKYRESAVWKNPNDLAILLLGNWYARYENSALHEASRCIAISEDCRSDFVNNYSPPPDWECPVILWGVDHKVFKPLERNDSEQMKEHRLVRSSYGTPDKAALEGRFDTKTPLLLAVGRLAARKGHRTLLRAMPKILDKYPNSHLVIVGRGHMRKALAKQARALGIEDSVTIEEGMAFDDLAQLYRSADLTVYPSYYEGQGLIPLESMASGTPTVVVNHGPLPEMVDSEVGALFGLGDAEEVAESVIGELDDPELREKQATAGRERVLALYTYSRNADDYLAHYEDLSGLTLTSE